MNEILQFTQLVSIRTTVLLTVRLKQPEFKARNNLAADTETVLKAVLTGVPNTGKKSCPCSGSQRFIAKLLKNMASCQSPSLAAI
jgi:hypothetical protein